MKLIKIDNKPYQFPENWNELNEKQLLALAQLIHADRNAIQVSLSVLRILLPLKDKLFRKISPEDVFRLCELCVWVWGKSIEQSFFKSFDFKNKRYYLPEPNLENVTLIEFAMGDHFLRAFTKAKPDLKALDLLVATLCRLKAAGLNESDPEWNGDVREKYNSKIAESRADDFLPLPASVKVIVLHYFLAMQTTLQRQYRELYPESQKGDPKPTGPYFGWVGVIDDLAEDGIFGDWEKTAYTNIHTVCFHLRKKHYRLKELERKS